MDTLPPDVQALVDRATHANVREARIKKRLLAVGAVVLSAVLLLTLYVAWQTRSQQAKNTTRDEETAYIVREVRCYLVPGQPCYKRDQTQDARTVSEVGTLVSYALICYGSDSHTSNAQAACISGLVERYGL